MKFSHALLLASYLAFLACGDDDDSPTSASGKYDCSVTGGIKIVSPAGGETFKVGQEITVVFGTDIEDASFRITFKNGEDDVAQDLTKTSVVAKTDGNTCNEYKVKLDAKKADNVKPTTEGYIRIIPYVKTNKGQNSKPFTVKKQ